MALREGEVAQAARAEASEAAARRESTLVVEVKEGGGARGGRQSTRRTSVPGSGSEWGPRTGSVPGTTEQDC
jgi:hypothetical protein